MMLLTLFSLPLLLGTLAALLGAALAPNLEQGMVEQDYPAADWVALQNELAEPIVEWYTPIKLIGMVAQTYVWSDAPTTLPQGGGWEWTAHM